MLAKPADATLVAEEDWHFKVCKKVAQLTKVIYTLNCRNEDNEERTRWLIRCHNEEVARLKEACDQRQGEIQAKEQRMEQEKQDFVSKLESRNKDLLEKAQSAFADKVLALKVQLEERKRQLETQATELQQSAGAKAREEMEHLCKTKDESTANLVKEYNERYNAMLVEQMDAKDALERELNDTWGKRVQSAETALADCTAKLQSQVDDKSSALQDATSKALLLGRQLTEAKEHGNSLSAQVSRLEQERTALQELLDGQRAALDKTEGSAAEAAKRAGGLADSLETMQREAQEREREIARLRQDGDRLRSDVAAAENALTAAETAARQAGQRATDVETERDELRKELSDLRSRVDVLRSSTAEQEAAHSELAFKLSAAEDAQATMAQTHAEEMSALQASHTQALAELEARARGDSDTVSTELKKEMSDREAAWQSRMDEASAAHQRELAELEAARLAEQAALGSKRHDSEVAVQALSSELEELRSAHHALSGQLKTSLGALEEAKSSLAQLATSSEARSKADAETMSELRAAVDSLQRRGAEDQDSQRRAAEDAEARWMAERDDLLARQEREARDLRRTCDDELRRAKGEHAALVAKLEQHHADDLKEAAAAAEKRLQDATSSTRLELEGARRSTDKQLQEVAAEKMEVERRLQGEIDHLREQLQSVEALAADQQAQASTALSGLQQRVTELTSEHQQLRDLHEKTLDEAQQKAAEELSSRLSSLKAEQEASLGRLTTEAKEREEKLARELSLAQQEAAEHHRQQEERYRQNLEDYKARITEEHRSYVDSMNVMHTTRLRELQSEMDGSLENAKVEITTANGKVAAANAQMDDMRGSLDRAQGEVERWQIAVEEEKRRAAAAQRDMEANHRAAVQECVAAHSAEMSKVAAEHKRLADDFIVQRNEERLGHQAMVDELKVAYDELLHKYEFRESRPEDVTLINKLLKDNHDKTKALEKAVEDMRQYKLELINREENYNKVFGRRPVLADTAAAASPTGNSSSLPVIKTSRQASLAAPSQLQQFRSAH